MIKTTDSHCGYDFPMSPVRVFPFLGEGGAHEYHHLYNKGNYGSFFMFWDEVCKTNVHFKSHLKKIS
jgi:sterol desaturase/sphingolipid hydroxylase (fatty acid hydroxylase superfamily)